MVEQAPILSVGADIGPIGDFVRWSDDYNIKGYEYVFLDYFSLQNRLAEDSLESTPHLPTSTDILKSVDGGNYTYIILPTEDRLSAGSGIVSPSQIVPGDMGVVEESGDYVDKDSISDRWDWYFQDHFSWYLRLEVNDIQFSVGDTDFIWEYDSLVENPASEAIAWIMHYSKLVDTMLPNRGSEPVGLDGAVTFLPLIDDWSPENLITSIIQEITDMSVSVDIDESPEWATKWSLPNEEKTRQSAEELEEEIERKKKSLAELEDDIAEFQRYKTLLWGNEGPLEKLVLEVFEELGFEVEGEEPHNRDGLLHLEDTCFVMEITGSSNDIPDSKYTQLLGWVADAEAESDAPELEFVGILIANPRRFEEPDSRNRDEYFPPHLRRRMRQKGFKLLLTPTLYDILNQYRKGELSRSEIRDALMTDELVIEV